ncbi:hypothetical protein ACLMNJ_03965 [Streptomyces seoulensis]
MEAGHLLPARLDAEAAVLGTVTAALDSLGVREGVTHTEVIVTGSGPVRIVETHPRQAGDRIPYLLRDARGGDVVEAPARQSVGLVALAGAREQLAAAGGSFGAIWYATPPAVGEVVEVRGVDAVRARPGISGVVVRSVQGSRLDAVTSSAARPAHAWTEEALELVRRAVADLEFVVVVAGGDA